MDYSDQMTMNGSTFYLYAISDGLDFEYQAFLSNDQMTMNGSTFYLYAISDGLDFEYQAFLSKWVDAVVPKLQDFSTSALYG
eukprot:gene17585-23912_t